MKLGTETGSTMNHLYSRMTDGQPAPVVGMGATILHWTDRSAATVVSVEQPNSKRYSFVIEVQRDRSTMVGGSIFSESQAYEFTPNPDATRELFGCDRTTGAWVRLARNERGTLVKDKGPGLRIGERDEYRDPSF